MKERTEKNNSGATLRVNIFKDVFVELTPEQQRKNRIAGDSNDYDDAFIEALEENAKKMKEGK